MEDKKKIFYKYIIGKRRDKKNLYSLWDVYETIVNTDEEKADALSSLFNSKTGCPQDKCSPELVDEDREQNRPL